MTIKLRGLGRRRYPATVKAGPSTRSVCASHLTTITVVAEVRRQLLAKATTAAVLRNEEIAQMKKLASIAAGLLLGSALAVSSAMAQTVITWQMWAGGEEDVAGWQEIADLVNKQYPDIKVELQTAPWGDYWTKLAAQAAAGQMTDIFSLQSLRTPNFHQLMEPLGPYIERDGFPIEQFIPSIIEGMSWERQSLRPAVRSRHAAGVLQQGPLRRRRPRAHQ